MMWNQSASELVSQPPENQPRLAHAQMAFCQNFSSTSFSELVTIPEQCLTECVFMGRKGNAVLYFEVIGSISKIETIAAGGHIRDIMRLRKQFGPGRWRKMKGHATVLLENGNLRRAELHWYEAHGIGKRKMKIKRLLD